MPLLLISPYISWKGIATNSAVPSFSRPDLTVSGPEFKANPIKHWRKQLIPNANSGSSNRRAGIGMPMDIPGGSVYLGNVSANTSCLLNASISQGILKYAVFLLYRLPAQMYEPDLRFFNVPLASCFT